MVASNVVKHMDSNGLMYDLQHGFRERRSCETQLTMLIEDLARNASQGKQTDLVLLDFSKAFDMVSNNKYCSSNCISMASEAIPSHGYEHS